MSGSDLRKWTLKACPECGEAVALVNAPVHKQGCSHPTCEHVEVFTADALLLYGDHKPTCITVKQGAGSWSFGYGSKCDCGYSELVTSGA